MKREKPFCPYCKQDAELVKGEKIYGPGYPYSKKPFWLCDGCEAYVGCHPGTQTPLGSPANKETRKARNAAHAAFDPIWKGKKRGRAQAYALLAKKLGLHPDRCHIGYFDTRMCEQVLKAVEEINATL